MPFPFKLSVRLALMKAAVVVAAAAVCAACELPGRRVTDPNPPSNTVVQVFTSPDSVILDPYQTRQFLAYGRTKAGDSVAVDVLWRTSGGAVSAGGLYTSDTVPGNYTVTATAATAPVSGSSRVRNPCNLAQVLVTPASATVVAGGSLQFAAYGRKRGGDSVAARPTWASSGGSGLAGGFCKSGTPARG